MVNDGGSYAIRIRAEALAPELAARIANALAAAYLDGQRAVQADAREAASAWLAGRLREQRLAVLRADEAVERYRAENQLGRTGEPSLLDTRIGQVSSALADAGTRLSRAQAGLAEVKGAIERGGDPASAGSVLASPTIQMLRGQEAEILVRHGALVREYGPRHPRVAEADAQLEAVRAKIKLEAERIVAGMRSDVSASKGEIDNLQGQLSELEDEARRGRPTSR